MKKLTIIIALLFLIAILAKGQNAVPTLYYFDKPFEQVDPALKDTVRIYIAYIDTSMKTVTKLVKVGRKYEKQVSFVPSDDVVKFRVGYGVRLKNDGSRIALPNASDQTYHEFSFSQYLDELKIPFRPKYLVIDAIGLQFKMPFE